MKQLRKFSPQYWLLVDTLTNNGLDEFEYIRNECHRIMKAGEYNEMGDLAILNSIRAHYIKEHHKYTKLRVGDSVVITDEGQIYTVYVGMFKELNFIDTKRNNGDVIGTICTVTNIGIHKNNYVEQTILYKLISGHEVETLISSSGVRK